MDREEDATNGRDQCEQETSGPLCRCVVGTGSACSFIARPHHLPHKHSLPHSNNDKLDLIISFALRAPVYKQQCSCEPTITLCHLTKTKETYEKKTVLVID